MIQKIRWTLLKSTSSLNQAKAAGVEFDKINDTINAPTSKEFTADQEKKINDSIAALSDIAKKIAPALESEKASKEQLLGTLSPEQRAAFEKIAPQLAGMEGNLSSIMDKMGPDAANFMTVLSFGNTDENDPRHIKAQQDLAAAKVDPQAFYDAHKDAFDLWTKRAKLLVGAKLPPGMYDHSRLLDKNIGLLEGPHRTQLTAEMFYARDLLVKRNDSEGAKKIIQSALADSSDAEKAYIKRNFAFADDLLHPVVPTGELGKASPTVTDFGRKSFEELDAQQKSQSKSCWQS